MGVKEPPEELGKISRVATVRRGSGGDGLKFLNLVFEVPRFSFHSTSMVDRVPWGLRWW